MTYHIIVLKNGRRIGELKQGHVVPSGTCYPHPSSARLAARGFLKKFPFTSCKIVKFNGAVHSIIDSKGETLRKMTPLERAAMDYGRGGYVDHLAEAAIKFYWRNK